MGTSGSSKGPGSNTPLVPTWLDPDVGELPGGDDLTIPDNGQSDGEDGQGDQHQPAPKPILQPPEPRRFQGARRNFNSFVRSGDERSLRRGVRDYVRSGTRGSTNAVHKMGSSRTAAGNLLGTLRSFQRDGAAETLRRFNLANLVERSIDDIFLGLTDTICRDGGSVDEGIARDAWLETLAQMEQIGIENLDALNEVQVRETFLSFIVNTIETKLFQEIGVNGLKIAPDNASIQSFQNQLHDYIDRGVRDSYSTDLKELSTMTDDQIMRIVDSTYQDAWDLFVAWGNLEE